MAKGRIRHLAIVTRNPAKVAEFYKNVFELDYIEGAPADGSLYLTDGYFNLAILPHSLSASHAVGFNHFGFVVESRDETVKRIIEQGEEGPKERPPGRAYAELRGADPEGNMFDISEHGYERAQPASVRKPEGP